MFEIYLSEGLFGGPFSGAALGGLRRDPFPWWLGGCLGEVVGKVKGGWVGVGTRMGLGMEACPGYFPRSNRTPLPSTSMRIVHHAKLGISFLCHLAVVVSASATGLIILVVNRCFTH